MSGSPGRPTGKSFAAVLWFPVFFAAAFAVMFLGAFASPAPHDMKLGVTGTGAQVTAVEKAVRQVAGNGVEIRRLPDRQEAEHLVRQGELAGAYVAGDPQDPELLLASASSAIRADYLKEVIGREAAQQVSGAPATSVDLVPAARGDVSGVGLFFYAMPLLLVGMITSIVLLQAVTWTAGKKAAAIAATGAFASVSVYAVAVSMDVVPAKPVLIVHAFLLTQAIGWLTTAVALLAKHHFMPVAMTFVLILGIPTAGGSVPPDMLPAALGALHQMLPFGQFIDLVRSSAYFGGHDTVRPLITLLGWIAAAATLFTFAARRRAST
ncbi:hypothetical protein [Streptomyces jeddahensis]|uniref:ABC-2 family transporter protein n=1 Tax=Streptomyces jeddahensis TaxID=1716141 RepID=A0A177HLG5_9ACTN|nr:hypothetical protein [Streptomyces jeddahensis]OAH11735.1 ABC-2 family transporter protein [Streptomyces jeddahensis]